MPSSAGRTSWPAREHHLPGLEVLAGEAPVLAGLASLRRRRRARRPRPRVARSCITTVSAPAGITPPVKMRTHSPAPTRAARRLAGERLADAPQHRLAVRPRGRRSAPRSRPSPSCRGRERRAARRRRRRARDRARSGWDALDGGDRREKRADQRARPVDRHRVRIVVVGAGGFAQGLGLGHGSGGRSGSDGETTGAHVAAAASPAVARSAPRGGGELVAPC